MFADFDTNSKPECLTCEFCRYFFLAIKFAKYSNVCLSKKDRPRERVSKVAFSFQMGHESCAPSGKFGLMEVIFFSTQFTSIIYIHFLYI